MRYTHSRLYFAYVVFAPLLFRLPFLPRAVSNSSLVFSVFSYHLYLTRFSLSSFSFSLPPSLNVCYEHNVIFLSNFLFLPTALFARRPCSMNFHASVVVVGYINSKVTAFITGHYFLRILLTVTLRNNKLICFGVATMVASSRRVSKARGAPVRWRFNVVTERTSKYPFTAHRNYARSRSKSVHYIIRFREIVNIRTLWRILVHCHRTHK